MWLHKFMPHLFLKVLKDCAFSFGGIKSNVSVVEKFRPQLIELTSFKPKF